VDQKIVATAKIDSVTVTDVPWITVYRHDHLRDEDRIMAKLGELTVFLSKDQAFELAGKLMNAVRDAA
jgi:hypothetical protein